MAEHESDDELWAEFVREHAKNNAVREPSAAERALPPGHEPERTPRRRGRRIGVVLAAVTAAAGVLAYLCWPTHPVRPGVSMAAHTPSPTAGSPAAAVPLSVFAPQLKEYTLVADVADQSCTGSDTVGPTLAGLITQSKGCLGVDLALYRDADGNQYSLALFTMKDPLDTLNLTMQLSHNVDDYEVAVQLPPKESGLRQLPADSGLVQTFASVGRTMLVGMAQWSDGHTGDYNTLVGRLTPLTDAVIHRVPG